MSTQGNRIRLIVCLVAVLVVCGAVIADEEERTGWTDTAEFSFVSTSGNTESTSLGFKNVYKQQWEKSLLGIRLSAVRVETEDGSRYAVGIPPGPIQVNDPPKALTTEIYEFDTRYNRDISSTFFWYVGAGWYRNRPSGVDSRLLGEGGVGNIWKDKENLKFKTTYGVTYTDQEDVIFNPTVDETFAGGRLASDFLVNFGKHKRTSYTNVLIVDLNFDESSAWRLNMQQGLSVLMSEKLALKIGLQSLYVNEPPLEVLDRYDTPPGPGDLPDGTVAVPLDELDNIMTISLVVDFK